MATPHVAGYAAYLLGLDSSLSPTDIASCIDGTALNGVLSDIREFSPRCCTYDLQKLNSASPVADGTVNKLLNNGL